jgi:hypothetical protein
VFCCIPFGLAALLVFRFVRLALDKPVSRGSPRMSRISLDSLVEEDGFEPSVPPQKTAFFRDRPESGDDKPAR